MEQNTNQSEEYKIPDIVKPNVIQEIKLLLEEIKNVDSSVVLSDEHAWFSLLKSLIEKKTGKDFDEWKKNQNPFYDRLNTLTRQSKGMTEIERKFEDLVMFLEENIENK